MSTKAMADLGHIQVHDVMHQGVIDVDPESSLLVAAELMSRHRVHAVAVMPPNAPEADWKIVSALDAVAGIRAGTGATVNDVAATEMLTIPSGESVDRAAQLMAEHELWHLLVTDRASGRPIGVISTLDILAAVAG